MPCVVISISLLWLLGHWKIPSLCQLWNSPWQFPFCQKLIFPDLEEFHPMHVKHSIPSTIHADPEVDFWGSSSAYVPPLQCSALWMPASLIPPRSILSSIQQYLWVLPGFSVPPLAPSDCLQAKSQGNCRAHLISFPYQRDHSAVLPVASHLKLLLFLPQL